MSDCAEFPAQNCVPIQWPGERETVYHELFPDPNIQGWFGSLVDDMRDATGQMYRRNRYYDPQTGQFTQPDPIGLAGGLNAYEFAAGDPVSYSDPYGLCPESMRIAGDRCPGGLTDEQWNSVHEGAETLADEERIIMLEKLAGGGISAAELEDDGRIAQMNWSWSGRDNQMFLNTRP